MGGLGDQITGKAKELEGEATGDPLRQAQGKAQVKRGRLKDRVQGAARVVKGALFDDKAEMEAGQKQRDRGMGRPGA